MNKKVLPLFLLFNLCSWLSFSQDLKTISRAYYTSSNFDYLSINPARAGAFTHFDAQIYSTNEISPFNLQNLSVSTSTYLEEHKIGIGGRLHYLEESGINQSEYNLYLAHHLDIFSSSKLSLGASPTLLYRNGDKTTSNENLTEYLPNLGLGIMYSFDNWLQISVSVPNAFSQSYWSNDTNKQEQQVRKGYLTVHTIHNLTSVFKIIGGLRIENTQLFNQDNLSYAQNPTSATVDLSLDFYDAFILGIAVNNINSENNRSIDYSATYFFRNGLRIGAAYNSSKNLNPNTSLIKVNLGYSINYKSSAILNARYL